MGYADGYYYGQGRIICDTSTFSVGDTIRVRSMTDSSKVWNQQVATVGTALVFTVPCYDYYKICTVQTINDTPTEIGGVYRTVDYGQTLFLDLLDKTTLGGIQGILNAHQENNVLNIGDEITIKISDNGTLKDWTMQVFAINLYDSHEVILGSKHIWKNNQFYGSQTQGIQYASNLKGIVDSFYDLMQGTDQVYLKELQKSTHGVPAPTNNWQTITCKIWIPSWKEVFSDCPITPTITQYLYPIFTSASGRIRTLNGVASKWWTCDGSIYNNARAEACGTDGNRADENVSTSNIGILPCFHLTADS